MFATRSAFFRSPHKLKLASADPWQLVKEGLLSRIPPSKTQADEQFKKAEVLLGESKKCLASQSPNSAVISAYAAMLDAARALLYRDGWREKSHVCTARYLEAKYSKELGKGLIDLYDEYRDKRHKTMYSSDYYPDDSEARRIVEFAGEFVSKIGKLL